MKKLILTLLVVFLLVLSCAPSFTVRYGGNEATIGTPPIDPNHYSSGDEATVREKGDLLKTGYEFKGWNTERNGEGTTYQPHDKIIIEDDVSLYAVWEEE